MTKTGPVCKQATAGWKGWCSKGRTVHDGEEEFAAGRWEESMAQTIGRAWGGGRKVQRSPGPSSLENGGCLWKVTTRDERHQEIYDRLRGEEGQATRLICIHFVKIIG